MENSSKNKIDLEVSKIVTKVPGFDDLFHGGLRLPSFNDDSDRNGICIAIYGNRGIGKADLAMQIMRGVNEFLKNNINASITPRYRTLNHRESELKKKYVGLEAARMINEIKLPNLKEEQKCRICSYFPKLKEELSSLIYSTGTCLSDCAEEKINKCIICKLIRHEVINYSDNSQTLNWTYGGMSDSTNLIDRLDAKAIPTDEIFDNNTHENNGYRSVAYVLFKEIQKELSDVVNSSKDKENSEKVDRNSFHWSSYVVEGFAAFSDDELYRLPFNDLINNLRRTSAVSVLVLDDRGKNLHLNADVIIQMQPTIDEELQYMYYQLQVVKSDLQPHVHGWHKYRKMRDLSVKIFPSVHSLLLKRFSTDNAVLRLEQHNLCYSQSLRDAFQYKCARSEGELTDCAPEIIRSILAEKENKNIVYSADNSPYRIELIETDSDYESFMNRVVSAVKEKDTTIAFFLLGKTKQNLRRRLSGYYLRGSDLENIRYWELSLGCIFTEEFVSIMREYINRWIANSEHKTLHLVFDDFANINLFPLMAREPQLIATIVNVCKNSVICRGYENNRRGVNLKISFVCSDRTIEIYNRIDQIIRIQ